MMELVPLLEYTSFGGIPLALKSCCQTLEDLVVPCVEALCKACRTTRDAPIRYSDR